MRAEPGSARGPSAAFVGVALIVAPGESDCGDTKPLDRDALQDSAEPATLVTDGPPTAVAAISIEPRVKAREKT